MEIKKLITDIIRGGNNGLTADTSNISYDELLKNLALNAEDESKYSKLMDKYNALLKGNMKQMIKFALEEKDKESRKIQLDVIKESFGLDANKLSNYIFIIIIEKLYEDINTYLELCLEEGLSNENELGDLIEELLHMKVKFSKWLDKAFCDIEERRKQYNYCISDNFESNNSNLYPEVSSNCNFIIYLSSIEEERKNTMNTKSGKAIISMSNICKEIIKLEKYDYDLLKNNCQIHVVQDYGRGGVSYIVSSEEIKYTRIGGGTTKVGFIIVPLSQENGNLLRRKYNNDSFKYLILVINFGDFKNEGIDERRLYQNFRIRTDKYEYEIEEVIRLFKEPFTPDSFEKACYMIENGISITNSLSTEPLKPINWNDKGRI